MAALLKKIWDNTCGASAVEYGLVAASIAVALIVTMSTFGGQPTPNLSSSFTVSSQ